MGKQRHKLEVIVKGEAADLVEALRSIADQLEGAGVANAPNDMRELENDAGVGFGFYYDVTDNDGTDIYGNEIEDGTND